MSTNTFVNGGSRYVIKHEGSIDVIDELQHFKEGCKLFEVYARSLQSEIGEKQFQYAEDGNFTSDSELHISCLKSKPGYWY